MGKNSVRHKHDKGQPQEGIASQLGSMREEMLRFATLQLRDTIVAEDVVHEAINAALVPDRYSGKGSLKSWVFAILRNKIIDVIRERSRHPTEQFTEDDGSDLNEPFNQKGAWKQTQKPLTGDIQKHFWRMNSSGLFLRFALISYRRIRHRYL